MGLFTANASSRLHQSGTSVRKILFNAMHLHLLTTRASVYFYYYYYYYRWGLICVLPIYWGPIKDTKRTWVRLDRNVAPCSRPTTNVIDPLHECKKVCPCTKALPLSDIRVWIKQGWRKRKKRGREIRKTEARSLMERKAAQQNKTLSEELKQGLPRHSSG